MTVKIKHQSYSKRIRSTSFLKNAIEPTGYLWEKVAQSYLETACPEKSAKVTYDFEAGMFAC